LVLTGRSQERITQGANKSHSVRLITGRADNAVYSWQVTPATGTSTNVGAVTDSAATIVWDGLPGIYILTVSVIDGNGCVGEQISKEMEIIASGDLVFAAAMPSTTVCSDLEGGLEGSSPPHTESLFQVVYAGESNLVSATFTIENPGGEFVGLDGAVLPEQENPEITLENDGEDKTIDLAVSDAWENTGSTEVQFTVTLVSAVTNDDAEIVADPETDIVRSITVLPKPVIEF
jgi:hypothetical protein